MPWKGAGLRTSSDNLISKSVARAFFALSLAFAAALPARAAEQVPGGLNAHGGSRELQADALRSLPLNKLTAQGRALATTIVNDTTIFRRLPQQVIEADAELYVFLLEHPELVINMWEVMGVTKVTIKKIGPTSYHIDDGQGTSGDIHFLYRSQSHHVVFCEGVYTGTLMPRPIKGRCILSLRSAHVRDADDRSYLQCRLDSFVKLDSFGVEVFAKTFQSMIGSIADHNFRETTGFVSSVSAAAEAAPENLHRIASKCRNVTPETKQEFASISNRIYRDVMGMSLPKGTAAIARPVSAGPVNAAVPLAGEANTPIGTPITTARRLQPAEVPN
ncbi:MAG: hypothetical protein C0483_19195 [Pirellula sp.]|nr:hypothetical protein [Pirellula sp.]